MELTAVDLVQYSHNAGGLSRAATVLEELCEAMDMNRFTNNLCNYTTLATLQRLGYIMENVLSERAKADVIYDRIKSWGKKMIYRALDKGTDTIGAESNDR